MPDVVVIGAGIAGLSAAFRLEQSGVDVVLLDARAEPGGVIRSERADGFLLEHGPNSIQSRTPHLEWVMKELDLESKRIEASDAARVRYIVKGRRPVAAPSSPAGLITSPLFGAGAKLRVMREPFVPPAPAGSDESVADFIRRRLGSAFLDYGMDPFVAGVYAGDPERLSVKHAFPSLVELEQTHGSIIKGQIEKRRDSPASMATSRMFSFRDGIQTLPNALANRLSAVHTTCRVESVAGRAGAWNVKSSCGEFKSRAVIYAAPLHALDDLAMKDAVGLGTLAGVPYPPLSVVFHGFKREHVLHPLDGFGMLVPSSERDFRILGTLFTSSIFPGRAPDGHVLLTTFVGGMRHPELAGKPAEKVFAVVRDDLDRLLGLRSTPVFERQVHWKRSIPQYILGYDAVLHAIEGLEGRFPGWFMAGNYRSGISVGETAASGDEAGRRCAQYLGR